MSDSTIDDALRLLEIGKGNPDRLKQIIESFQKRSMISMQDRKYVDALVEQYLTPRHRQMTSKMKPSERQKTNFPRIRKTTESSFKITEVKATSEKTKSEETTSENPYDRWQRKRNNDKSTVEIKKSEPQKEELASKEPTIEEKFIEHVEKDRSTTKKSNKGKVVGIIIGIIAIIAIGGGAAYMGSSSDLLSSEPEIEERITCQDNILLVSATKIPNFPAPGKDLKYYQDRYDNEPTYKDWFDRNFPDQTVREAVC